MNMLFNGLIILIVCIALFIIGVSMIPRPDVTHYKAETPSLSFRDYFDGPVEAWGIFTDRTGKVQKRFTVHMHGHWVDDDGVIEEHFQYSDGTSQDRTWRVKALPEGHYRASAGDIIGMAEGEEKGNAVNFHYTLALPISGSTWNVQFDDWMYLVNEDTLINKATMSKWGVRLGEVTLFFKKKPRAFHVTQSTD